MAPVESSEARVGILRSSASSLLGTVLVGVYRGDAKGHACRIEFQATFIPSFPPKNINHCQATKYLPEFS